MTWEVVRLGEITSINPRDPKPDTKSDISFVGMAELNASAAATVDEEVRPFGEVSKGYTQFRNGDLLLAKITPCWENGKIGEAKLNHAVGVGSTEFHIVRPSEKLDKRYTLHFLRAPRVRINGELRMTGSGGQRRVPTSYVSDLEIPVPPLEEQRRIAAILDEADEIRTKRRAQLALLDELPQSLFHEMFGDPTHAQAQTTLGEIAELLGGRNLIAQSDAVHETYRVLKISAVTSGVFNPGEAKPLPADYDPPASHVVNLGDLLISRANTTELVGAVAYVSEDPGSVVLPDKIWRFNWKSEDSAPLFYATLLRSPSMRRRISELASGSGGSMKNISKAKLQAMHVPKVEAAEQQAFAEKVEAIQAERSRITSALKADDKLFAALQYRAFRGELSCLPAPDRESLFRAGLCENPLETE
ncbi:restriction endonuclease subunit S [Leucobacter coleopterorum]|uniref:restriction endonuclease subunit S n=1 Tax=Leucobacter coleopterorum TaxID=2714933 RepID=UPI00197CD4F5|nr:restriction endonuclease subunit S [Leucobacter coleopterorum]